MKKRTMFIIIAAMFLLGGIEIILFPSIQEYLYGRNVNKFMDSYFDQVGTISKQRGIYLPNGEYLEPDGDTTIYDALYELLKHENERLYLDGQSELTDAFSYEQASLDLSPYGIIDNCIGFIDLPTIDMKLPLFLGANTANMKKGAVHLTQTSYPIGGNNTNCVIAAHRGTSLVMFRNIHLIKLGDEITITNFRETLTYKAVEIKIINPKDIAQILIQSGRDLVTLISCNPLGQNYERYVVYCERV